MIGNYPETINTQHRGYFDSAEREHLIIKYAQLVKSIASRMSSRLPPTVSLDELISAGCLGLIDAIDRYDPEKDVNLKTYAAYRIKGAILDELRSMDWYSRSMRKKIRDIEKAIFAVESRNGRLAEDTEVAQELGLELERYYKILADIQGVAILSLDEYIRDQDNETSNRKTFQNRIRSKDDPSANVARQELKQVIAHAIKKLSEKEQLVVSLYYQEELTLKEVGNVLGLTESRICQIHTAALLKLKNRLKEYYQK